MWTKDFEIPFFFYNFAEHIYSANVLFKLLRYENEIKCYYMPCHFGDRIGVVQ